MNMGKHLVFGAGLIGGFVAGGLMAAGIPAYLLARAKIKEQMRDGLRISDYLGNEAVLPAPAFVELHDDSHPNFDYIWLTVKCTAITSACAEMRTLVGPNTTIICCQNGLGSDKIVSQAFPANPVIKAIVGFNVSEPRAGHLHRSTEGRIVIEQATDHSTEPDVMNNLAKRLNSSLHPTVTSPDIEAEQWAKLQLNLSNPVGALSDIPIKQMLEDRGYRLIIARLMLELLSIVEAKRIKLPKVTAVPGSWIPRIMQLPDFLFNLLGKKMIDVDPTARLSMWWDLEQEKLTEIDFLNGAVVREGQILGIACPANEALVKLIKDVEGKGRQAGLSANQINQFLMSKDA